MAGTARYATLICSIDIPAVSGDASTPHPWLQTLARELAGCEDPVTITLLDLAQAGEVQSLLSRRHELALRVDASWGRPEAGRPTFAQTLRTQLQLAQAQGVEVTTLAWGDFPFTPHTDLLVKHGINAVRTPPAPARPRLLRLKAAPASVHGPMIRYGVCTAGTIARWQPGQAARSIRRTLAHAIGHGLAHLVCDLADAQTDRPFDTAFRQALLELTRHRHLSSAHMQTIAQYAETRLAPRPSIPAQSILRAA